MSAWALLHAFGAVQVKVNATHSALPLAMIIAAYVYIWMQFRVINWLHRNTTSLPMGHFRNHVLREVIEENEQEVGII
jgi:hypothetical protein